MNERINQLALQAGYPDRLTYGTDLVMEKFAELIIKECMGCATWVGKVNENPVEPIHTAHAVNLRIKKHFGVEE
jgi:hypothetical protein